MITENFYCRLLSFPFLFLKFQLSLYLAIVLTELTVHFFSSMIKVLETSFAAAFFLFFFFLRCLHGSSRSAEEHIVSWKKHSAVLCSTKQDGTAFQESDCEVIEVTSATCKQEVWNAMTPSRNATENITSSSQGETKTLILFEDVDIIFDDDRGFTAMLLQLAETAKRPMILTSNSKIID